MTGVRTYFAMAALAAGVAAWPAHAQQPSQAEKDAIRSNCRSDFMAKCSSVKPGGVEAIQCLKKNDASLSSGCRSAVSAIKLPGEAAPPAPAAAPAAKPAAPPAAASAPPAPQTPAPAASAPKPAEPAAAVAAPAKPEAAKPAPAKPVFAPKPAVAATPPAPVTAPPPPAAAAGPKLTPLQEARLVRQFCTVDAQTLCKGVRIGEGRIIQCLAANQPALSPGCKAAMAKAR